ncbi:hypothetical protein LTR37_005894 [Vermiconidia calcicola]|uniref:Uncharacterized protein n=1 Tax=Vermiconidia calcicola TaxID=1690605 RepID=A0ACC3NHF6_9PEZI|nr:hypothetical protein LTR37_005894 [Vermiconidia calcicola]
MAAARAFRLAMLFVLIALTSTIYGSPIVTREDSIISETTSFSPATSNLDTASFASRPADSISWTGTALSGYVAGLPADIIASMEPGPCGVDDLTDCPYYCYPGTDGAAFSDIEQLFYAIKSFCEVGIEVGPNVTTGDSWLLEGLQLTLYVRQDECGDDTIYYDFPTCEAIFAQVLEDCPGEGSGTHGGVVNHECLDFVIAVIDSNLPPLQIRDTTTIQKTKLPAETTSLPLNFTKLATGGPCGDNDNNECPFYCYPDRAATLDFDAVAAGVVSLCQTMDGDVLAPTASLGGYIATWNSDGMYVDYWMSNNACNGDLSVEESQCAAVFGQLMRDCPPGTLGTRGGVIRHGCIDFGFGVSPGFVRGSLQSREAPKYGAETAPLQVREAALATRQDPDLSPGVGLCGDDRPGLCTYFCFNLGTLTNDTHGISVGATNFCAGFNGRTFNYNTFVSEVRSLGDGLRVNLWVYSRDHTEQIYEGWRCDRVFQALIFDCSKGSEGTRGGYVNHGDIEFGYDVTA